MAGRAACCKRSARLQHSQGGGSPTSMRSRTCFEVCGEKLVLPLAYPSLLMSGPLVGSATPAETPVYKFSEAAVFSSFARVAGEVALLHRFALVRWLRSPQTVLFPSHLSLFSVTPLSQH